VLFVVKKPIIMKSQPTNVSPLWFFTKIGIICVLGVVVFVQAHGMLWKPAPAPAVQPVIIASSKPEPRKQASTQKREQPKTPRQPAKPSLTEAMKNPETYAMIRDEFKRRLDSPYGKLYRELNLDPATLQKLRGFREWLGAGLPVEKGQ